MYSSYLEKHAVSVEISWLTSFAKETIVRCVGLCAYMGAHAEERDDRTPSRDHPHNPHDLQASDGLAISEGNAARNAQCDGTPTLTVSDSGG